MLTRLAKFYGDARIVERDADEIVLTIKRQCNAKGRTSKWIEYDAVHNAIIIVHFDTAMYIEDNKDNFVSYDASRGKLTVANNTLVTIIDI